MDSKEIDRLCGKIVTDKRKRGSGRYPWAFLEVVASYWMAGGGERKATEATKPAGIVTNASISAAKFVDDDAQIIADRLSGAQAEALLSTFKDGHPADAGKATVGALVNKGLVVVADDPEDGYDLTDLGKAVGAILAKGA